jgi:hypothetical protein
MRNAPWALWIHDLSMHLIRIYILPLVMTATTLLQTALNPAPPDPLQAKLMWFMPLAFSVMFFFFPSGLVLYWITNNVLSIAQQWVINTRMGVPPQVQCGALPKFWITFASTPIAAVATASGRGAVGIVRVSGHGHLTPLIDALCRRALWHHARQRT